jgi:lipopolysaccharide/colanic/teichoic acid biosynthesis glycosyltransferase
MMMKTKRLHYGILGADLCWCVVAMAVSYALRYERTWQDPTRIPISTFMPFVASTLLFWGVLSSWLSLDGFRGGWRFSAMLSQLFPAVSSMMALLFAGAYLARLYTSRLVLGYFAILLFVGLIAIRLVARAFFASRYRAGAVRKAVIVGSGPIANEIAKKIECHPEMLWEVAGFLCPAENAPNLASPDMEGTPIHIRSVGIADLLRSRAIDELILAVPKPGHPEISDLVNRCLNQGIAVSLVPQPYELYLSRPTLVDLDGLPLLKLEGVPALHVVPFWKRLFDLSVTICMLPVAGPAILAAAGWLKMRKGKAFSSEIRCGQSGQTFLMYRLNSQRRAGGLPLDEFLMQQSSLTELPQIVNVLRGHMSLVGPRPEGPEKVRHYSDWHRQRLSVKPGITGLAQVHGLRDQNSSEDKTRYDLQYILHRSLFFDVSLLLQTLSTLALRPCQLLQLRLKQRKALHARTNVHDDTTFEESLSSAHSSQSSAD